MGFGKHVAAALAILLLALGLITFVNSPDESDLALWKISNPQYTVIQSGSDPEPDNLNWPSITLPYDGYRQFKPDESVVLSFNHTGRSAEELALMVSYSARPFSVWLGNDTLYKPTLPSFPGRVFAGAHLVPLVLNENRTSHKITLIVPANQSGTVSVGNLYFGPIKQLNGFVERSNFVRHTLSSLIVYTMLLSALFVFGLWALRPLDSIYLWYALAVITWAFYSFGHIPQSVPFDVRYWDWLRLTSLHFWPVLVVVFCNRFINRPQPVIESVLALYAASVAVFTLFLPRDSFFLFADAAWPSLSYLIGFYASWIMLQATFRQRAPNIIWMTVCGMLIMVLSLHDIAVIAHWIDPWRGVLLHYAAALLVLVFTSILMQRFVAAFTVVETLNKELSGQVAQKSNEIAQQLSAMRQLERDKALAEERARLMRDMHDGIGGELNSLRAAVEQQNIDEISLQDNLSAIHDELYLMVQSLDTFGDDLGMALGQIRPRLESKVTAAGMKFVFNIGQLPMSLDTSNRVVLHVIRIIQEAVTNSVRHAAGSCVELRVVVTKNTLDFKIIDDGNGLLSDSSSQRHGHGMHNMQERACSIGGSLKAFSAERGTSVVLSLPWGALSPKGLQQSANANA